MTGTTITKAVLPADKKRGMTLDQLAEFVASAFRNEVPGTTPVNALVGFRGQVQALTVKPEA